MTIFDTLVAELGDPLLTARRVPVEPRPKRAFRPISPAALTRTAGVPTVGAQLVRGWKANA